MKLRNKKTGEIVVCGEGIIEFKTFGCKNLAEFLESGWEDYKPAEPLSKDEKTIVNITQGWGVGAKSRDIILPEGCTDWFVTDYDGSESLWYVLGGKLYNEDHKRIDHEGRIKEEE